MKPFQCDFGGRCPPELENVSHAILRKCEGLPLAIATIGALLSTKNKGVSEWKKFCYSLGSQLEKNSNLSNIRKILLLSFYDMPDYLKPCFLYFGLLPEDYQMSGERLVRLWIAEGFLEKQKGKTLEEVGEEYLIELVHKNLVQISERGFDGGIRSCRVHDLVREIVLTKSVELGFCHVLAEEDSSLVNQARRVSMHMNNTVDKVLENTSMKPRVRSVLIFSVGVLPNKQLLSTLAANFKLLKVLDLQDAPLDQLDDEVGNLLHLRYLSVMNTKVKIIPKSIGNLHNLQTLNLANSLVSVLPLGINRLRKLRHLIAYSWNVEAHFFGVDRVRGVKIQGGIGHLEELQTLWNLESSHDDGIDGTTNLSKVLENLRQLRKLGILKLKRGHGRALCVAIGKMKHLQTLRIVAISADEILDLHSLSSPPECLQHLFLSGRLEKLPEWIPKLEDLKEVFLRWSGLTGDAIKALQALPNLIKLVLYDGYDGDQLYFEVGGFQKLQLLYLRALKGLNSITIEQGALPLLNELEIGPSPQLKEVPCGIHHLTKLSTLYFLEMPTEFMDRIQVERGQDYWIVKHIPDVKFFFFNRGDFNSYTPREFQDARERESLDEANNGSQS